MTQFIQICELLLEKGLQFCSANVMIQAPLPNNQVCDLLCNSKAELVRDSAAGSKIPIVPATCLFLSIFYGSVSKIEKKKSSTKIGILKEFLFVFCGLGFLFNYKN